MPADPEAMREALSTPLVLRARTRARALAPPALLLWAAVWRTPAPDWLIVPAAWPGVYYGGWFLIDRYLRWRFQP